MNDTSSIGDNLGLGITVPSSRLIDADGHRKVHPVSPLVHAAGVFPAIGGVVAAFSFTRGLSALERLGELPILNSISPIGATVIAIAVVALLLSLLIAAFQYLEWRVLAFWFDDDGDFRVRSGVLFRNERRVQLSRIQAVDVTQPFAARIFSMAVLVIEVAGQNDSRIQLKYLHLNDAREIRRQVLARAADLPVHAAEAPQEVVSKVPARRLATSLILRMSTLGLLIASGFILFVSYFLEGWGGLVVALFTGGVPLFIIVTEFVRYYGFTVAESPDGLRLRFGLLRTESRTIPAGRVQAVDLVEPLLWRRQGWTRVRITIAGVGTDESNNQRRETMLIPVATLDEARDLVSKVLPELNVMSFDWQPAPPRARWRSPMQWSRLAVAWDDRSFAARSGRITRHLCLVPHRRTQSVRWSQGPWERALGLASMHVDIAPGPVTVDGLHLDVEEARSIALIQARAATT